MTAGSSSRNDSARVSVDLDLADEAIVFEECSEADVDRLAFEHQQETDREARRRERRRQRHAPPRPASSTPDWATLLFAGLCFSEMHCGDVQVEDEEDEQLPLF